jgi:hypothetical protein
MSRAAQIERLMARINRPDDCTCDGHHTVDATGVDNRALVHLILDRSLCRAERRALDRILTGREASL